MPSENVATTASCASVIEGVSRSRNALLNGDTRNYDWDSGYTCHQLGSGAIVIQLAQPYSIGSLRYVSGGNPSSCCGSCIHVQTFYMCSVQVAALGLWWALLQLLHWSLHQPAAVDKGRWPHQGSMSVRGLLFVLLLLLWPLPCMF